MAYGVHGENNSISIVRERRDSTGEIKEKPSITIMEIQRWFMNLKPETRNSKLETSISTED
jgi:hypothetical protein